MVWSAKDLIYISGNWTFKASFYWYWCWYLCLNNFSVYNIWIGNITKHILQCENWACYCIFMVSGNTLHSKYVLYCAVIMGKTASQITSLTIDYSSVHSGPDQRKHQSSASLAFVREIQWWPVNSQHKWSVTWKTFQFDDAIMSVSNQEIHP